MFTDMGDAPWTPGGRCAGKVLSSLFLRARTSADLAGGFDDSAAVLCCLGKWRPGAVEVPGLARNYYVPAQMHRAQDLSYWMSSQAQASLRA